MKTTLENASETVVWLGPTNSTLTAAFDILQIPANRWNQAALHAEMPLNWTQSRPEQLLIARDKLLSFLPEPLQAANTAVRKAIQDVFCSPCLKRVNIIPEQVLSVDSVTPAMYMVLWMESASRRETGSDGRGLGRTLSSWISRLCDRA